MTHLSNWGLTLVGQPLGITGRVLPPETICLGGGYKELVGPKADWGRAATSRPSLTAVKINKWAIFLPEKNTPIVQNFVKTMTQVCGRMGMSLANPKVSPRKSHTPIFKRYKSSGRENPKKYYFKPQACQEFNLD